MLALSRAIKGIALQRNIHTPQYGPSPGPCKPLFPIAVYDITEKPSCNNICLICFNCLITLIAAAHYVVPGNGLNSIPKGAIYDVFEWFQ